MRGYLSRGLDRPATRPANLALWLDDKPRALATLGLALQHLAIQSVYFIIPAAVAAAITDDAATVTRFVCLSVLAAVAWQVLNLLRRGPVGSGYPVPATHTAAMLGAYLLVGETGGGFGGMAAMVLLAGIAAIALTFAMQRLRVLLPNEVAGVVVMLIGVALAALGTRQIGLQSGQAPGAATIAVVLVSVAAMAAIALSRTRAAPFALLLGSLVGVALALPLGEFRGDAAEVLAAQPWFALPEPFAPDFGQVTAAPLLAFLLALVAMRATAAGSLVMAQRALDAGWTRPDAPPIRRGLLADGIAIAFAGLVGGAAPGPNTAALGLSVTGGVLARRIVWAGVPLLLAVAFCPKLVALFVLAPAPVKAAMLFHAAGLIMANGCQLVTVRLLDSRRGLVVATGLTAGIAVASAPLGFLSLVPALASPLSFGAVVAFLVNLVTLPLVTRRAELSLTLDMLAGRSVSDWVARTAAGWGLKPATARSAERALVELAELLAGRGVRSLDLAARLAEDRVEFALAWAGAPLPAPAARPDAEALLGDDAARDGFVLWLATRETQSFAQRETPAGQEVRLAFED
ncbi:solute carrier family 23 protein [Falsiroseomonas sp. HW251]|uniref:solute carrier family 23 protein n=1 Tax=Falsiroseomonas sp. HW251 TaxID=3390998 RepID=UPI003D31AA64